MARPNGDTMSDDNRRGHVAEDASDVAVDEIDVERDADSDELTFRADRTATVVVVTGAAALEGPAIDAVPAGAIVIAADGGFDHAVAAGLTPTILIGDLDSVSAEGLAAAERSAVVAKYPPDKDATDTELALAAAVDLNPDRLVMLAGSGDRLDHTLAAIGALGDPSLTSIPIIDGWWGDQYFRVQHGPGTAVFDDLVVGSHLSLLATHGECVGVNVSGVRWQLEDFTLAPLSGRGISNEVTDRSVTVSLRSGVLTIMFPGPTSTD